MDTGSGKTHVAVARILAELEKSDPAKACLLFSPHGLKHLLNLFTDRVVHVS